MHNNVNSLHFPLFEWLKRGQQVNQDGHRTAAITKGEVRKIESKPWEAMYDHLNFSRRGIYFPQR